MAYIQTNKNQNWLLPMSIKEMIPKDHICFLVEEFAEYLDYSKFDIIYDGAGHPAYPPRIIMKIIIQGMPSRVRSSRKLAASCRENFVMMYLVEKTQPDFRTIARFRKDNAEFVKDTFKKTVEFADGHQLVDLSFISIDGSTLKANTSKKRYFDKKNLDKLDKAIDRMVEEDIALDELEEQIFGDREEGLTGMDERDLKRLVKEYRESENKKKIKKNIKKAKGELEKYFLKKVSVSEPESRMMQNKKGFSELSYNAQLSVSKNQIILANDVCQDGHDAHQFIPQMRNIRGNIKLRKKTKVGVDYAYSDGENIKFAEDKGIDLYVPSRAQAQDFDGKVQSLNHDNYEYDEKRNEIISDGYRYKFRGIYTRKNGKKVISYYNAELRKKKDVPFYFKERLRMRDKMSTEEGKTVYNLRKITVEPVVCVIQKIFPYDKFPLSMKLTRRKLIETLRRKNEEILKMPTQFISPNRLSHN